MARYIDADKIHEFVDARVAEGKDGWAKGVPYEWAYALTVIDMQPTADVAPRAEVAREIFEEIYETMNSVYASVQHSCVGMHGDNPETMRLLGKLEGVKRLGDEIAELKKKYQIESTEL